jgi:hypothetical protein
MKQCPFFCFKANAGPSLRHVLCARLRDLRRLAVGPRRGGMAVSKYVAGTAWSKSSASVYDAQYDENNVYVHSNQPYQDAAASADGHSWSYETNGSGYAEIYLNGPPPGAQITVTVGGAVCTTSD